MWDEVVFKDQLLATHLSLWPIELFSWLPHCNNWWCSPQSYDCHSQDMSKGPTIQAQVPDDPRFFKECRWVEHKPFIWSDSWWREMRKVSKCWQMKGVNKHSLPHINIKNIKKYYALYKYLQISANDKWLLTYCPHKSRMLFIFAFSHLLIHPLVPYVSFGSTSHLVSVCLSTPESRWRNLSSSSSVISPWISEGKGNGETIEDLEEEKKEDKVILPWTNTKDQK